MMAQRAMPPQPGAASVPAVGLTLAAADVVPAILEVIAVAGQARVRAAGTSMWPTIPNGALVTVCAVPSKLRPGQIVLMDWGGRPVLHRIIRVSGGEVQTAGDSCLQPDPPVTRARVHAVAVSVLRGDQLVTLNGSLEYGFASFARFAAARTRLALARGWRRLRGFQL